MPIQSDKRYIATVESARTGESSGKGTPGIFFKLLTEDGPIDHTVWLTEKTRTRAQKTMQECFGATAEQMADRNALILLLDEIGGSHVEIRTGTDSWKGKERVVVRYMDPVRLSKAARSGR